MSLCHSVSTKQCLSRAILPVAPELILPPMELIPSHITFAVNPGAVHSPQTGHPWYVEMDHNMQHMRMYSLVPQPTTNQYVSHFRVESKRPRFIGKFTFSDAWVTSHHRLLLIDDLEVHISQCLFNPERAHDKLYFDHPPHSRVEIVAPNRFIEDREIVALLEKLLPKGSETRSLLQRRP